MTDIGTGARIRHWRRVLADAASNQTKSGRQMFRLHIDTCAKERDQTRDRLLEAALTGLIHQAERDYANPGFPDDDLPF